MPAAASDPHGTGTDSTATDTTGVLDDGVLEALLNALLETAACKDARRAWPKGDAPERDPRIQARRDADDDVLHVFRFFEIVSKTAERDPNNQLTAEEARERIAELDDEALLKPGDEVGLELPIPRLAAIALADVDEVVAGHTHLLPARIVEMLGDVRLRNAATARLSTLRGPPPHVPLRRLVTDHGGAVVDWSAVTGEDGRDPPGAHAAAHAELCVATSRGDESRLTVVSAATSAFGHTALLRAIAPAPPERSLWRFLEVEGPALLNGAEGALWSDETTGRRLSLEVTALALSRDPAVYGVARARARLLTWANDKIVDDQPALVGLPVDLPRMVSTPYPEGAALERVRDAARSFRARLQQRLTALLDARAPTAVDALQGAAILRVMARAAAGESLTGHDETLGEPLVLRAVPDETATADGILLRLPPASGGGVASTLLLSPADDAVRVHTGSTDVEIFASGAVPDGDFAAWSALAQKLAHAIVRSDVDVELEFPRTADNGAELPSETLLLSTWLGALMATRVPPRADAENAAGALQDLVDRFVDGGPLQPAHTSKRPGPAQGGDR